LNISSCSGFTSNAVGSSSLISSTFLAFGSLLAGGFTTWPSSPISLTMKSEYLVYQALQIHLIVPILKTNKNRLSIKKKLGYSNIFFIKIFEK